jgi:predicted membrane-bound spermidine synthase
MVHPASLSRLKAPDVLVVGMFFASGFAGLVYEVTFAKSLGLVFGSSATAATTVLATYMGGMSIGSWLGGKLGTRTTRPLRWYAVCEAGVGATCAIALPAFAVVRRAYVGVAAGIDSGRPALVAVQVVLGSALLLPPTILMGMTLPLLGKQLEVERTGLGRAIAALYGANTLGAAAGALATGYALLQYLGVRWTTFLAVVTNLAVALAAFGLNPRRSPARSEEVVWAEDIEAVSDARARLLGLVVLGGGGAVTLALEGVCTHLLAVVAGNSAFAFAAMLFCFLLGLGLGSSFGRAWLRRGRGPLLGLGLAQTLVGLSVLGGVFAWDAIPEVLGSLGQHSIFRSFAARELARLVVCALTIVPPALFIGASFPLAMDCAGRGAPGDRIRALGRAAAINTLGNIAGALAGGFLLLPRLGSLRTMQLLGCTSLALAVVTLLEMTGEKRRAVAIPLLLGAALVAAQPRGFDLGRLASGSNVYFTPSYSGEVIDHAESVNGGLTTVHFMDGIKTLNTNGKFQGNDAQEVGAQLSFALIPLLHTTRRDSALVIGFGTGTTSRVVSDAGFSRVDIAELSGDLATLADRHFASLNHHVLGRDTVHLHVTDGRNFLLVEPRRYDLVTVELSSIWFAGAASLYNVEFYELAKRRLAEGGVLQQWLQIHHLGPRDYVAILSAVRAVFPYVSLYVSGGQGQIIACAEGCAPSEESMAALDGQPGLADAVRTLGGAHALSSNEVLGPSDVDRFLAAAGVKTDALLASASTDDNLLLEYSTPRGNVRDFQESYQENIRTFFGFSHGAQGSIPSP